VRIWRRRKGQPFIDAWFFAGAAAGFDDRPDKPSFQAVRGLQFPAMKRDAASQGRSAAIWKRVVELGELSPGGARALLRVRFSERDHALMAELSRKARAGSLTPDEQTDLDTFERLGCLLDILHSKARQALKKPKRAS
jgi:hypothetical protein